MCARLCHSAGGELEQVQFLLGHVSVETTERYLGCKQRRRGALFCVLSSGCSLLRPPDLPIADGAKIISAAPEFNRYAQLVKVERVHHLKGSMDTVSYGEFRFRYLDHPSDAPTIMAKADFRYIEGKWYLNEFFYGCPGTDCHIVNVVDGPDKKH